MQFGSGAMMLACFCRTTRVNDAGRQHYWTEYESMGDPPRREEFPEDAFPLQAVTGTIIASAFSVFRKFGYGFLEPVYRRALAAELRHRGVRVDQEVHFELYHHSEPVGSYRADLIVDARVIVETKTGAGLDPNAPIQLLNYLCAARLSLGLVVHFGPNGARVKRVVASDSRTFQAARDGPKK